MQEYWAGELRAHFVRLEDIEEPFLLRAFLLVSLAAVPCIISIDCQLLLFYNFFLLVYFFLLLLPLLLLLQYTGSHKASEFRCFSLHWFCGFFPSAEFHRLLVLLKHLMIIIFFRFNHHIAAAAAADHILVYLASIKRFFPFQTC